MSLQTSCKIFLVETVKIFFVCEWVKGDPGDDGMEDIEMIKHEQANMKQEKLGLQTFELRKLVRWTWSQLTNE